MKLPEFQRRVAGSRAEDADEMAGILETDPVCDVLNFCLRLGQKKLFGFRNAKVLQISVDGAAEKSLKQAGQVLRSHIDQRRQLGNCQRLVVICFDFLYHREHIFLVLGMFRRIVTLPAAGKAQQEFIALCGQGESVQTVGFMGGDCPVDEPAEGTAVGGGDQRKRRLVYNFRYVGRQCAGEGGEGGKPYFPVSSVGMGRIRRNQDPFVGFQGEGSAADFNGAAALFRLEPVVERVPAGAPDRFLIPVVSDAFQCQGKIEWGQAKVNGHKTPP